MTEHLNSNFNNEDIISNKSNNSNSLFTENENLDNEDDFSLNNVNFINDNELIYNNLLRRTSKNEDIYIQNFINEINLDEMSSIHSIDNIDNNNDNKIKNKIINETNYIKELNDLLIKEQKLLIELKLNCKNNSILKKNIQFKSIKKKKETFLDNIRKYKTCIIGSSIIAIILYNFDYSYFKKFYT